MDGVKNISSLSGDVLPFFNVYDPFLFVFLSFLKAKSVPLILRMLAQNVRV